MDENTWQVVLGFLDVDSAECAAEANTYASVAFGRCMFTVCVEVPLRKKMFTSREKADGFFSMWSAKGTYVEMRNVMFETVREENTNAKRKFMGYK